MKDQGRLLDAMGQGVVTIVFEKIDTKEIRKMPCTTNKEVANMTMTVKTQDPKSNTIVTYALDKKAWRDVRTDTIIEWYKGYPKDE